MNGTLIPLSGGEPIPLLKERVIIGRQPTCDVRLTYANVSGKHCELLFQEGAWTLVDLGSTNGVKVNGKRIVKKRLRPGDDVTVARKHHFRIDYEFEGKEFEDYEVPFIRSMDAASALEERASKDGKRRHGRPREEEAGHIFDAPLLEKAGLVKRSSEAPINDEDETPLEEKK